MNLQEDVKSVTYLKTRSAEVLSKVNRNHRPIVITQNGEARAVVQDIASYEATRRALLLLKAASQGEADFKGRRFLKHDALMKRLAIKLRG